MPKPNPTNPPCPTCTRIMRKVGKNATGKQQYKCSHCGKTLVDTDNPVGRPKPEISRAEYLKAWRKANRDKCRASDRAYREKKKECKGESKK